MPTSRSSYAVHDMPRIGNYAQAAQFWEQHQAEAGRKGCVYLRFRGGRLRPHKYMERATADPAFLLYLYDTPLVEYAEDGRITIRGQSSSSSRAFVWYHTGLDLRYCRRVYFLDLPHDRTVQFQRTLILDGDGNPISGAMQRQRLVRNRAEHQRRLGQLRKFKVWYDLMSLLYPTPHTRGNGCNILAALDSEDYPFDLLKLSWHDIKSHYLNVQDPNLYDVAPIPDTEPLIRRLCHNLHGKGVTS